MMPEDYPVHSTSTGRVLRDERRQTELDKREEEYETLTAEARKAPDLCVRYSGCAIRGELVSNCGDVGPSPPSIGHLNHTPGLHPVLRDILGHTRRPSLEVDVDSWTLR